MSLYSFYISRTRKKIKLYLRYPRKKVVLGNNCTFISSISLAQLEFVNKPSHSQYGQV